MASLQARKNKDGQLSSFLIRVYRGRDREGKPLKPYTTTFKVQPGWTEKTAWRKASDYAAVFEEKCRSGLVADCRERFDNYCDYVIGLKEERGLKHTTATRYRELTKRIYPAIGHIKLNKLQAQDLNKLYSDLAQPGVNKYTGGGLSPKTIIEHHRLISSVLENALKEGLVATNIAKRATLPKVTRKEVNYFQPEEVAAICEALESEPIKWRTMIHLFMITGARRGEILGLKWDKVDLDNKLINICRTIMYTPDRGIYEDTPKTETSVRNISLPTETVNLLRQYKVWQNEQRLRMGEYWQDQGFVFCQDDGSPMHPDSVPNWLSKFTKRHGLPHINAHAFRHTMASMLFFNRMDSVSISHRLGHAQVSTTANIYAHVIEEADQKSAEILSSILLQKKA